MKFRVYPEAKKKSLDLSLELLSLNIGLLATVVQASFTAVVVGVVCIKSVGFLFGRDGEATLAAPKHASEGKFSALCSTLRWTAKLLLYAFEFIHRNYRRMLSGIQLTLPLDQARVEWICENVVD